MKGEGSLNEKKEMKEGEKKSEENEERQRDTESKNIFNEERSIDIGSRRATDMRCNRRVILPKDMTLKEEAMLDVRKEAWLKPVDKFIEKNCDKVYVNDVNIMLNKLAIGSRYDKEKEIIKVTEDDTKEDIGMGRSESEVTIRSIKEVCETEYYLLFTINFEEIGSERRNL